ncbi:MAG: hypothetical protein F4Y94_11455 [Chloroflexi bacterium]|nr:hypothetical protein [Chloroflexota bacterium]
MRPAGLRALVVVAVVVAAVGVGLWSAHGSASAQAPAASTISTELQPGWNLVGWMGPDTTTRALFDAIPELNLIVAWDDVAQRHRWAWRPAIGSRGMQEIGRGRGLALHIGGESAVEWTRPAAEGVVLLPLQAGNNLVTWGGPDGTPIDEALDWLGDAVMSASRWNADTRASDRYRPGAPAAANTLRTLNHGDALWVRLSEDASWWQSGTAGTEFDFKETVTPAKKVAIRTETARVLVFFAEVYGMEPVDLVVTVDPAGVEARSFDTTHALPGEIYVGTRTYNDADGFFALSHEYFHVFQWQFRKGSPVGSYLPDWLIEGTAQYVSDMYEWQRLGRTGADVRGHWWSIDVGSIGPHRPLTDRLYVEIHGYWAGALATDWLVRRAAALSTGERFTPLAPPELVARPDHDAHLEFFRLLPESASWEEAFEAAFGIALDDFYEEFEEYRIALGALHLPHLADDRDEPLLVFLGEIPSDTRIRIREQFDTAQDLFRERFRGGPVDYTVFVAASDRWAKAAYEGVFSAFGGSAPQGECVTAKTGVALFVSLANCPVEPLADSLGAHHFEEVLERVAPADVLSPWLLGYEPPGPYWLRLAMRGYATHAYRDALGIERLEQVRSAQAASARSTSEPLSGFADYPAWPWFPPLDEAANALSFLAGDRLVARAGEPAIIEYYRLLGTTDNWQEAFEAAFGITIGDFYQEFAEYRSAIGAVAPPDAPGELAGPQLVLLGEFDSWLKAALPAQFEAVQAFFGDRLGGEPVDYTVYLVATPGAATAHRDLIGVDIGGGIWKICRSLPRDWEGPLVIVLSGCGGRTADAAEELVWFHYERVLRQLTPPLLRRGWPSVHMQRGSYWLDLGLREYAERVFLDSLEHEDLDRMRPWLADFGNRAEGTLSDFEPYPDWRLAPVREVEVLSFLAADWLLARAGERAIFEYYRLRQTTDSWQDAFEAAFGTTVDDFYTEFAEYRAGL